MSHWTPQDWAMFFTALGTFIAALFAALAALLANIAKLRTEDNAKKIDANTKITREGTQAAATNAEAAASAASVVAEKTDQLATRLNGELDEKVSRIVQVHIEPITKLIKDHADQDERNFKEILSALHTLQLRLPTS